MHRDTLLRVPAILWSAPWPAPGVGTRPRVGRTRRPAR